MVRVNYKLLFMGVSLAFLTGCLWGLTVLRNQDAQIRRDRAKDTVSKAETIAALAKKGDPEDLPAIQGLAATIKANSMDQWERAEVALSDHETDLSQKDLAPQSVEADENYNEYAGLVKAKAVRRKALEPARLASKVGGAVLSIIPWWIKAGLVIAAIWAAVTTGLAFRVWVRHQFNVRMLEAKDKALDEYDEAIEKLDPKERKKIAAGQHLKREHFVRNEARNQDFQKWAQKFMPIPEDEKEIDECKKHLEQIGSDTRHRLEDKKDGGKDKDPTV